MIYLARTFAPPIAILKATCSPRSGAPYSRRVQARCGPRGGALIGRQADRFTAWKQLTWISSVDAPGPAFGVVAAAGSARAGPGRARVASVSGLPSSPRGPAPPPARTGRGHGGGRQGDRQGDRSRGSSASGQWAVSVIPGPSLCGALRSSAATCRWNASPAGPLRGTTRSGGASSTPRRATGKNSATSQRTRH